VTETPALDRILALAQVRPYERMVRGRLEDVSGYQNHKFILNPDRGSPYLMRLDEKGNLWTKRGYSDWDWTGYPTSARRALEKHAVDITQAMPPVPDVPEHEALAPELVVDEGADPELVRRGISALPPGVRDELARAGVKFHATSAAFLRKEAGSGTIGLYEPEKLIIHVATDPHNIPGFSSPKDNLGIEHTTAHEAGHALDHILGSVSSRDPKFWTDLGDKAFTGFGSYPRSSNSEAFAELFAAVTLGHWNERHEAYDYQISPLIRRQATDYMRQLGIKLSDDITRPSCVARWDGEKLTFGPPGWDVVLASPLVAAAGLVLALAHEQHVKTVKGAEWYDQPIGSLIVKKPHLHADIGDDHHMVSAGGHHYSIPSGAKVYVGTKAQEAGNGVEAAKLVQFGPEGHAKYALLTKDGAKEIVAAVAIPSLKSSGWTAYHTGPPKPDLTSVKGAGGVAAIHVNAENLASAISILNAAKSTNVKPPLAKAGHPLADMDYMAIAKEELAAHPELAVPSGTKAKHVGKVKLAVLHHLAAKLAEVSTNDAEAAHAESAKETATEQAHVAQVLTPSVLDFHGLAVTQAEMQAAADAVDATGSHGSLSVALKKIDSPLAKLDHYAVAKTWKADHPEDKGLNTKAAYTKALHGALADLKDSDQVTGHEAAAAVHEAVQAAPASTVHAGFDSAYLALAGAMVAAKSTGNAQYSSSLPGPAGDFSFSEIPPAGGAFYTATSYGTVKYSVATTAPSITLDSAKLHEMVGPYLKGTSLEIPEPKPTIGATPKDLATWEQELLSGQPQHAFSAEEAELKTLIAESPAKYKDALKQSLGYNSTNEVLAAAMVWASTFNTKSGVPSSVYVADEPVNGMFFVHSTPPLAGAFWAVSANGRVWYHEGLQDNGGEEMLPGNALYRVKPFLAQKPGVLGPVLATALSDPPSPGQVKYLSKNGSGTTWVSSSGPQGSVLPPGPASTYYMILPSGQVFVHTGGDPAGTEEALTPEELAQITGLPVPESVHPAEAKLASLMLGPMPHQVIPAGAWQGMIAAQMWHSVNETGGVKVRYVYKDPHGNWFTGTSDPGKSAEYYRINGMSVVHSDPGTPGLEVISLQQLLGLVGPYFGQKPEPATVPSDVAEMVKPGNGGIEIDPLSPHVAPWISQIPGGEYVGAQTTLAKQYEAPRVVFVNKFGNWAYNTANNPPDSYDASHGWWKVYPAGHATYYPPPVVHPGAAGALKEALESAKAQAGKSAEDIQAEKNLKAWVTNGVIKEGVEHPSDLWSKVAVALKKSADKPGSTFWANQDPNDKKWYWSGTKQLSAPMWYEAKDGLITQYQGAAGEPEPVSSSVILSVVKGYFDQPGVKDMTPAGDQASLDALVSSSKNKVMGGDDTSIWSKIASALIGSGLSSSTWYVTGHDPGPYSTTQVPPGLGVGYTKVTPGNDVIKVGSTGNELKLPPSAVKAQVAEWLVPDLSKPLGTDFPHHAPDPDEPLAVPSNLIPAAPGVIPVDYQVELDAGDPVDLPPEDSALIAAFPGGEKANEAIAQAVPYAYHTVYVKQLASNPGAWIKSANLPTGSQQKAGYWTIHKATGSLTVTYNPPKKLPLIGTPEGDLYELMLHGAVVPPQGEEKKDFYHVLARAANLSAKGINNGVYYVVPVKYLNDEPAWTWDKAQPASAEYWKVEDGFTFTHFKKGEDPEKVPVNTLTGPGGISSFVTPNATVLSVGAYPVTSWKAVKYGHWYKPKGGAHVEIYPTPGGQAAKYWYANGSSKDISATKAGAYLNGDFTEHFEQAKAGSLKAKPAVTGDLKYASAAGPGHWLFFTGEGGAETPKPATIHPDGSMTVSPSQQEGPALAKSYTESGWVTDQFGNSVLTPGAGLHSAHVFGKFVGDTGKLSLLLKKLQESDLGTTEGVDLHNVLGFEMLDSTGNSTQPAMFMLAFLENAQVATYPEEKSAIAGLLQEMISAQQGFNPGSAGGEPVFLKGLPAGIHHPQDIFDFGTSGYAKPYGLGLAPMTEWGTVAEMKAQVKGVSLQFGGGKVVGTHTSSMGLGPLQAWIKAWKSGDMAKVFELDAAGGKVSPVHPGAPKNVATHKIIWAPYGEGQLPAGQPPLGNWSAKGVAMPQAEVDNYLIGAGLQHAEFLSWENKRAWVNAHRDGEWYAVNKLTKQADESWLAHDQPQTPTPKWTENIAPAKAYSAHLEDKVPAGDWPVSALNEFVIDHGDDPDVKAAAEDYNSDQGYGAGSETWKGGYTFKKAVVQRYLNELAAKEALELAKPRFNLITAPGEHPASVSDQFGRDYSFREGEYLSEPAVSALASAWGFKMPRSQQAELEDGTPGLVTDKPDVTGPLAGKSIAGLTPKQVAGVAKEHVLDWVLASPFGHAGNLLLTSDGGVISAFKPEATEHLGWDGLAGNDEADEHAKLAITQVFDAIRSHEMPQPVADEAATAAIKTARRMAQMQDYRLAGYLIAARGETPETASSATKELVGALVTRKATLGEDIEDLWHRVYEDAGWKPPEIPKEALPYGLHSGFSEPSYFDHVMAAKSFGAPAFFAGTDLDEAHFVTWTELSGENRLIRGESRALGSALTALTDWCKANQTHGITSAGSSALSQMTQNVVDVNLPKGDPTYYGKIISGAKAVSRHAQDQMFEGTHTKTALDNMEQVKAELETKLLQAGKALEGNEAAIKEFMATAGNGHPWMFSEMAKHYLGLIAKVEDAKANQATFQPGELPKWEAPELPDEFKPKAPEEPKAAPKVLKVERKKSFREAGIPANQVTASSWLLGKDDGELHLTGNVVEYPGDAWHITLPSGEIIEFNDSSLTGTPSGPQTGRIRFKADASRGSASLEDIRSQLETMGLALPEATPADMELLYWRHLASVLANRRGTFAGDHAKVWASLHDSMKEHGLHPETGSKPGEQRNILAFAKAGLEPSVEIAAWRKAWAVLTSKEQVDDWADAGGFYPHLRHWDLRAPEVTGGQPVWQRFDATPEWLRGTGTLDHSFHNSERDAVLISRTGGGLATEARIRVLGSYIQGTSSNGDMTQHGSSGGFYLHPPGYSYEGSMLVNPGVLAHTQTYGFDNDAWGDLKQRANESSPYGSKFDLKGLAAHTQEILAKDGVSILDDIELIKASSSSQRDQIIKELKDHGLTTIRGLPVEDRITTASGWSSARAKIQEHLKKHAYLERGPVYIAPPQEKVSIEHAMITTEAEAEAQAHVAEASADHSNAASKETLNKVYYGSAGGDPQSTSLAKRGQVKNKSAERIAGVMTSSDDQMVALMHDAGLSPPASWGSTPRALSVAGLLMAWAANGSNGPLVQAAQNRAHLIFGMPKDQLPVIKPKAGTEALAKKLEEGHAEVIDDFLRAMHSTTQEDLSGAGVTHLTQYRLMKFESGSVPDWAVSSKPGDVIDAPAQRAFSSWGMTPEEIDTDVVWGSGAAVMVKATFPIELALAYPKSGLGCYPQGEFVMLDAPGKWEVVKNQASS
jgi:hypothetical protein